jgi:hypothetical protein
MIKIIYDIEINEKEAEIAWLREQKVYPSCVAAFSNKTGALIYKIGVIVNTESALAIKLRHKLELQTEYKQR